MMLRLCCDWYPERGLVESSWI